MYRSIDIYIYAPKRSWPRQAWGSLGFRVWAVCQFVLKKVPSNLNDSDSEAKPAIPGYTRTAAKSAQVRTGTLNMAHVPGEPLRSGGGGGGGKYWCKLMLVAP